MAQGILASANKETYSKEEINEKDSAIYAYVNNRLTTLANPIINTVDDTTQKWVEKGNCTAFYNSFCLNGQPNQYGMLINIVYYEDVFQIWNSQSVGPTYFRSGNVHGFSNWRKVMDNYQFRLEGTTLIIDPS